MGSGNRARGRPKDIELKLFCSGRAKKPYYDRRKLVKIRELILLDLGLSYREKIALLRTLDDLVYQLNVRRKRHCRKNSIHYKKADSEITRYKNRIKALEAINEIKHNNSSPRKLRDSKKTIATFREYASAK